MGQRVYYFIEEQGNEKWHSSRVIGFSYPGLDGHPLQSEGIRYRLLPDKEAGQTYEIVEKMENELRDWSWARPCLVTRVTSSSESSLKPKPLLPLDRVGIDTCSALSVSTESDDYVFIDDTPDAKQSVSLRGIGGEQKIVGGRGPLVICTQDENHSRLYMIDSRSLPGQGIVVTAENPRPTKDEEVRFRFGSK